jgi:hypothetical protein
MAAVALLLTFVSAQTSAMGNTYNGRVYFWPYHRGEAFNPFLVFHSQLNYYIDPSFEHATLTMGSTPHTYNIAELAVDAIDEWEHILGADLIFNRVFNADAAQLVITANPGPLPDDLPPNTTWHTRLAAPARFGIAATNPEVVFHPRNFERVMDEAMLLWFLTNMRPGTYTDEAAVRMTLRAQLLHELGHVLGFAHPNPSNTWNDVIDSWLGIGRFEVLEAYDSPSIPIMEANIAAYFQGLRDLPGRGPLVPEDPRISISPQERRALIRLRVRARMCPSNAQPHARPLYKNTPDAADVDDCVPFKFSDPAITTITTLLLSS